MGNQYKTPSSKRNSYPDIVFFICNFDFLETAYSHGRMGGLGVPWKRL